MARYCPVCGEGLSESPGTVDFLRFDCQVCGEYRLSERAAQGLFEVAHRGGAVPPQLAHNHHLLSAVIRERYEQQGRREVFIPDFDEIRATAVRLDDPFEAVDRILLYVARTAARVGDVVSLHPAADYPIAYAQDQEEFKYYLSLGAKVGMLELQGDTARPSPDGWRRLKDLYQVEVKPDSAFVAMSISDDLQEAYREGIQPALESTGFRSIRVDLVEHSGKIDDRIIADIRRSYVLVADFTGHRQNVYFEAGFALGLGRHVILTCRESEIDEAHFDTRQYNHVLWRDAADLRERLQNRIEATIPRRS